MSDRDPRRQSREIREALEHHDREQLIEILTHVFRHYVMQGDPPAVQRAAQQEDFAGLSFAQIIELLQLRTSVPELQLFEVQGGRVSLRVGGQLVPIEAPQQGPQAPLPAVPPPSAPAPAETRPAPAAAAPAAAPPVAAPAAAPRQPAQARAVPIAAARQAGAAAAPAAAPAGAAPAAAAQRPAAKDAPGEDAGGRFTLLEID